jgi:Xaa-Pro aminopeptidase
MNFPRSEYEDRWQRARELARERHFDALLVWSRGGATVDAYADVLYLANHYSPFPLIGDLGDLWAGRSHAAVILPVSDDPILVVDQSDWRRDLVAVDHVQFAIDLPATVGRILDQQGLATARVGLVAGNALLVSPYRRMLEAASGVEFVPADDAVEFLRSHKSTRELEAMRNAAEVGDRVMTAIIESALQSGTTEAQAAAAGHAIASTVGAAVYDTAIASGPHSHSFAYGRLPSWTTRRLEAGDIFHVDAYGAVEGYLFDFGRTCVVGGRPTVAQLEVMDGLITAVQAGVESAAVGLRVGDIFAAVHTALETAGLAGEASLTEGFPAHGHSLGMSWERPWILAGEQTPIEIGMCFGIEAMGGRSDVGSAFFEQNVAITPQGTELLTRTRDRYW